jgi:hypothetical protein
VKNADKLPVEVSIVKYDTISAQIFDESHGKKYYVIK